MGNQNRTTASSFNDGLCTIWDSMDGEAPAKVYENLRYREEIVGAVRYFAAKQAQVRLSRSISVPMVQGVNAGQFVEIRQAGKPLLYQIEQAQHWFELPDPEQRANTYLRLLSTQMGVGGDDSWGSPVHDEYMVDSAAPHTLDITLSLI